MSSLIKNKRELLFILFMRNKRQVLQVFDKFINFYSSPDIWVK